MKYERPKIEIIYFDEQDDVVIYSSTDLCALYDDDGFEIKYNK